MKKLSNILLACGITAACLFQASAAPTMRISGDGGLTWLVITDNGPLDANPVAGLISYNGPVGSWFANAETGFGQPLLGSPSSPLMDVSSISSSAGAATLIVQLSDTNFVGFPNETFIGTSSGTTAGAVNYSAFRDTGNVLFGTSATYSGGAAGTSPSPTASLLFSAGPSTGTYTSSNSVVVGNGVTPFALTLQTTVIHTAAGGETDTDSLLYTLPPPPCNSTLTFNSPLTLTKCADDTIDDVTATLDSGAGPVPVLVTLLGVTTNLGCPLIVTRNYTASDACGVAHPFTQTITVNCKPDCTISTSVTTALVGGTGYTASVADAGVGATYDWTVLNGTITAGLHTRQITWSAGTDTNSPISILVTVTAGTGCQSGCSASVKLGQPPKTSLGGGDTATIGFWQNKNGQGLILGASNAPALANWLATTFPCLYGSSSSSNLTGKANSVIAARFITLFKGTTPKTDAQVMCAALGCYFTSTSLGGGTGPVMFGFNQSPGGTGSKTINVGSKGTDIGLQVNGTYTILNILKAANNWKCSHQNTPFSSNVNDLFNSINTTGDIK